MKGRKSLWVNFTPREAVSGNGEGYLDLVINTAACPVCWASKGERCKNGLGVHIDRDRIAKDILNRNAVKANAHKYCDTEDVHAREIIEAIPCNFCRMPAGAQCVVWNRSKTQPRPYPHAARSSDYHKLKRQQIISTWKDPVEYSNTCTSRDCPVGPDCTDSCMERVIRRKAPDKLPLAHFVIASNGETYNTVLPIMDVQTVTGRVEDVSRKDVLTSHLDRVLTELDKLEALGEDVYEDESVLLIKYKHTELQEKVYSYVAYKCDGRWFVTGYQNDGPRSWNKMVEFFSHGIVTEMWYATDWEQVI